jgi:ABC-type hemin transport system ATPase subunit
MKSLTLEEKIEFAEMATRAFRREWYELDFAIRFNNVCAIVNPNAYDGVQTINKKLTGDRIHVEKKIEFLERELNEYKLKPLEEDIKNLNNKQ